MKQFLIAILISSIFFSCNNKSQCEVKGKLIGIENTKGMLQYINYQGKMDSIKITGNSFSVIAKCTQPQLAILAFEPNGTDTMAMMMQQPISFAVFLEPGKTINVLGDAAKPDDIKFTGSKLNTEFLDFQSKTLKPILQKEKAFIEMANEVVAKNPTAQDSLQRVFTLINLEKKEIIVENSFKNKNSIVAATYAYLVYQQFPMDSTLIKLYDNFSDDVKKSFAAIKIKEKINAETEAEIKKSQSSIKIGNIVPNFSLKDINGKTVELKSLYTSKKLLLIDFWASWCGPCRKENPNLVATYKNFEAKGFDIVSISIDEKQESWKDAIKADNLVWSNLIEPAGWQSKVVAMYGVQALPANFLVDQQGKLVAQNLIGNELTNQLTNLLK